MVRQVDDVRRVAGVGEMRGQAPREGACELEPRLRIRDEQRSGTAHNRLVGKERAASEELLTRARTEQTGQDCRMSVNDPTRATEPECDCVEQRLDRRTRRRRAFDL